MVSSTNKLVMEMNYFPNTLTVGFKKGTFACTFQSLNASSFSKLGIYIYIYIYKIVS